MRHSQPNALTLLVSGYPDVQRTMAAILLEANEIIVKPFEAGKLAELIHDKMLTRKPAVRVEKERVAAILQRCATDIVHDWLVRVRQSNELNYVRLSDDERTGPLFKLVEDLVARLGTLRATAKDSDLFSSPAAMAHGMRYLQGYTPAILEKLRNGCDSSLYSFHPSVRMFLFVAQPNGTPRHALEAPW